MSTDSAKQMVADYLAELEREAERLDATTRQELLEDVRNHIEVALAESENADDSQVAHILSALGAPREIVDAASPDEPFGVSAPPTVVAPLGATGMWDQGAPYPLGGREIAAILLLLVGAFLIGVGWLVGLWLLWSSPRWSLRDKLIGTFVLPGGLGLLVAVFGVASSGSACTTVDAGPPVCTHTGVSLSPWAALLLALLLVALPLATSFHLWRRARAVRPEYPAARGATSALMLGTALAVGVLVAGCGAFLLAGSSTTVTRPVPAPVVSQVAPEPSQP